MLVLAAIAQVACTRSSARATTLMPDRSAAAPDVPIDAEVIHVPAAFHGTALVVYSQPDGMAGAQTGDTIEFTLPATGLLRVLRSGPSSAIILRRVGSSGPIRMAVRCAPVPAGQPSGSRQVEGCWLPWVGMNVASAPPYVAFVLESHDLWAECTRFGVALISEEIYHDSERPRQGHEYEKCRGQTDRF